MHDVVFYCLRRLLLILKLLSICRDSKIARYVLFHSDDRWHWLGQLVDLVGRYDRMMKSRLCHSILLSPFFGIFVINGPIGFVNTGDFGHERIVWVGIAQQGAY